MMMTIMWIIYSSSEDTDFRDKHPLCDNLCKPLFWCLGAGLNFVSLLRVACVFLVRPPFPHLLISFFSLFSSIFSIPLKRVIWITLLLRVACAQVRVGMRRIALPRHIILICTDSNFSASVTTTNFQASWICDESCVGNRLAHDTQTTI